MEKKVLKLEHRNSLTVHSSWGGWGGGEEEKDDDDEYHNRRSLFRPWNKQNLGKPSKTKITTKFNSDLSFKVGLIVWVLALKSGWAECCRWFSKFSEVHLKNEERNLDVRWVQLALMFVILAAVMLEASQRHDAGRSQMCQHNGDHSYSESSTFQCKSFILIVVHIYQFT